VVGVAEMGNLYGTGHGRSSAAELERAHARLVVNAAAMLATFLIEVFTASNWSLENPKRKRSPIHKAATPLPAPRRCEPGRSRTKRVGSLGVSSST